MNNSHRPPDKKSRRLKVPDHSWSPNARIPGTNYRTLRLIGEGGMGQVYEVERTDIPLPKRFALKVISREHCAKPATRRRLQEEAWVTAKLSNHKHVVEMIDFGVSADERIYYVMELLTGRTLYTELRLRQRHSKIDAAYVRWVLGIGVQVLSALEAAHAIGVVHRDVKPENVFLQENGVAKLLDFGIAKIISSGDNDPQRPEGNATTPGSFVGTPRYASPECVQAKPVDERSDIFSVGVMLWELLAQAHPLPPGNDIAAISVSIVLHGIPPLESRPGNTLPPKVCEVVRCATMIEPQLRYQTAKEFIAALLDAMAALPEAEAPWLLPADPAEVAAIQHNWAVKDEAPGASSTVNPLDNTRPTKRSPGVTSPATTNPSSFPFPLDGDPTFNTHREAPTRTSEPLGAPNYTESPSRTRTGQSVTIEPKAQGGRWRISSRQSFAAVALALASGVVALGAAGALLAVRGSKAPASRTALGTDLSVTEPPPAVAAATAVLASSSVTAPTPLASAPPESPPPSLSAAPTASAPPAAAPPPAASAAETTPPAPLAAGPDPKAPTPDPAKPAKKRPKPAAEPPSPIKRFLPIEMGKRPPGN